MSSVAPFVPDHIRSSVKRDQDPIKMREEELVNGPAGHGSHAHVRILIEGKIPIRIQDLRSI